jgi:sodium-dependent phosphate cotransporter
MVLRREAVVRVGLALCVVTGFLVAIQLLGTATGALAPTLRTFFTRVVDTGGAALGAGWAAAYLVLNGSVVAAVALALFGAELLTTRELLLLVAGSRLGAAGVVLAVGAFDHLRNPRTTARESMGLGVLTFLVTYSVYLPATLLSYLALPRVESAVRPSAVPTGDGGTPSVLDPLLAWLLARVGAPLVFVMAILALFASLALFDRLLRTVDTAALRRRYAVRLQRPAVSFLVGIGLTALSTSVAFSLGVVVPLYNRDLVTRQEMVPFVLGASVGTLSDTILVAVVLGSQDAVLVVLLLLVVGTLLSLGVLAVYGPYVGAMGTVQDSILGSRALFVGFVLLLLAVPLALVLV